MIVHLLGRKTMSFNEMPNGLFCHDTCHYNSKNSEQVKYYSFVETIDKNKKLY